MSACPVCGRDLIQLGVNTDAVACAKHGTMSGIMAAHLRGAPAWEAVIEIRAAQALHAISYLAWLARVNVETTLTGGWKRE